MAIVVFAVHGGASGQLPGRGMTTNRSASDIMKEAADAALSQKKRMPFYWVIRRYSVRNSHLKNPAILRVKWTYKPGAGRSFQIIEETGASGLTRRALLKLLQDEADNSRSGTDPASVTSEHYNFELSGGDSEEFRVRLMPRQKSKYLLNGDAFVERKEMALIRLQGTTSRRLSFWVGKAIIEQRFVQYGGYWVPLSTVSTADVRFAGRTELKIEAGEYHFDNK